MLVILYDVIYLGAFVEYYDDNEILKVLLSIDNKSIHWVIAQNMNNMLTRQFGLYIYIYIYIYAML